MDTKILRLFVASPGDVSAERDVVEMVAGEVNESPQEIAGLFQIEVLRWENARPSGGRPQQEIFDQLGPYDLFVGILWTRCGTPSGHDEHGHEIARSGTVEEIRDVLLKLKQGLLRKPQIMLYRCERDFFPQNLDEIGQFTAVHALFKEIETSKKVLTCRYKSVESFRDLFKKHLPAAIRTLLCEPTQPPRPTQTPTLIMGEAAIRLPHKLVQRESYMERILHLLATRSVCVLHGPSGSGKSTLAAQYFRSSGVEKRWAISKSALQRYAESISLTGVKLVVVDGFEDRGYCWGILKQIDLGETQLIVTTGDRNLGLRALRALGTSDESCLLEVGGLTREQWSLCLSEAIGERYRLVFDALHERFQGSVAGLRLLLAALAYEDDSKGALFGIRARLEEQAEVATDSVIGASGRYDYRHQPEAFIARRWWRHNFDAGHVLWVLSSVPLVGMSVSSLATLLSKEEVEVEQILRTLEQDSFVYPLHLGAETLWAALDYFRCVFESLDLSFAETQTLERLRDMYIRRCESVLNEELLGKLDSAFVRATRAFERRDLPTIIEDIGQCLKIVDELRSAQAMGESEWIPITHAISRRAASCKQVIPIAHCLTQLRDHPSLGDLAWQMSSVDDFWAASAAIFAAIKHWRISPHRQEHAQVLRQRLSHLLESDQWFSREAGNPWSDMLPAVLLGGLIVLGYEEWAHEELESPRFKARIPRSSFSHLVLILRAADCDESANLQTLLDRYWKSVRGGLTKQFAAEYLKHVYPAVNLSSEDFDWPNEYDPCLTAAQVAFSARAVKYWSEKTPVNPSRFKNDLKPANLLGSHGWFVAV